MKLQRSANNMSLCLVSDMDRFRDTVEESVVGIHVRFYVCCIITQIRLVLNFSDHCKWYLFSLVTRVHSLYFCIALLSWFDKLNDSQSNTDKQQHLDRMTFSFDSDCALSKCHVLIKHHVFPIFIKVHFVARLISTLDLLTLKLPNLEHLDLLWRFWLIYKTRWQTDRSVLDLAGRNS